jgi:hypothetical protein
MELLHKTDAARLLVAFKFCRVYSSSLQVEHLGLDLSGAERHSHLDLLLGSGKHDVAGVVVHAALIGKHS